MSQAISEVKTVTGYALITDDDNPRLCFTNGPQLTAGRVWLIYQKREDAQAFADLPWGDGSRYIIKEIKIRLSE